MFLRKIRNKALASAALLALAGCGGGETPGGYVVSGYIGGGKEASFARLYKLLPEYQKLMLVDSVAVAGGRFRFEGKSPEAAEAFVRIEGDTTAYCFVLTDNRITIRIGEGGYTLDGSLPNRKLSALLSDNAAMHRERRRLQDEYRRLAGDSVLTKAVEDSLLLRYRRVLADYRSRTAAEISTTAAAYPVTGRLALRLLQRDLTQESADSLAWLLAKKNDETK